MITMATDYANSWTNPAQEISASWKGRSICPVDLNHKGGVEAGGNDLPEVVNILSTIIQLVHGAVRRAIESYAFSTGSYAFISSSGPMIAATAIMIATPLTALFLYNLSNRFNA
jgi:hypothetical protein